MFVSSRLIYKVVALTAVGAGFAGVILPLLPTTPFLLIALWAATKGSPELKGWLMDHRHFGPALKAWHERKAIPVSAKYLACSMMTISWLALWFMGANTYLIVGLSVLFACIVVFILSRPSM
ncbi:YbaN family protein [Kangiella sediminilitoris]|uniref:Inner membrane protein n=1 Tax=Kangiella sediminilitoris TaxID=1144748 RepID=A0A1B3B8Y5_9GAMM|nr:YbaN family protein [Kangiella sediminilitoris]AOE49253.1 membrane protein [Kangiella sediminilitoris]